MKLLEGNYDCYLQSQRPIRYLTSFPGGSSHMTLCVLISRNYPPKKLYHEYRGGRGDCLAQHILISFFVLSKTQSAQVLVVAYVLNLNHYLFLSGDGLNQAQRNCNTNAEQ